MPPILVMAASDGALTEGDDAQRRVAIRSAGRRGQAHGHSRSQLHGSIARQRRSAHADSCYPLRASRPVCVCANCLSDKGNPRHDQDPRSPRARAGDALHRDRASSNLSAITFSRPRHDSAYVHVGDVLLFGPCPGNNLAPKPCRDGSRRVAVLCPPHGRDGAARSYARLTRSLCGEESSVTARWLHPPGGFPTVCGDLLAPTTVVSLSGICARSLATSRDGDAHLLLIYDGTVATSG